VGNDADGLTLADSLAFNNAAGGFYVNNDATDVLVSGNEAYGSTGNTNTDEDIGFQLRGTRMTVVNNRAYKVGAQFGDGIDVDSADQLIVHDNLAFNNVNGITISTVQGDIYNNETRANSRGLYVTDTNATLRTTVHGNSTHDNGADGLYLEGNLDAFGNNSVVNGGSGIVMTTAPNSSAHDNYVSRNGTGVTVQNGDVTHNRIVGNTGAGILVNGGSFIVLNGNSVYGNARGIEAANSQGGDLIENNLVYDNANYGIYVHGAGANNSNGTQLINNTVHHEVGSAIRLENNGNNVHLYNNIVYINGGFGIEVIGNVTGYDSNYNDIFPARTGALVGKFLTNTNSATLAQWQTASGKDANTKSVDPLFIDIDGGDNLLGWEQPDPQHQFADFGLDDNFHLKRGSPVIDAADSQVGPPQDADAHVRVDDLGTLNTGNGVFRFYDMGAFEFGGSSADLTPPTVVALTPIGLVDNVLTNARFSTIIVRFSEAIDPVSATTAALYSLTEAGPNGTAGDGDDVVVPFSTITYTPGDVDVRINLAAPLPDGKYRFAVLSGAVNAIVDQAGNALDGDSNGTAGGDFVRNFRLDVTAPTVLSVTPSGSVAAGPSQFTVVFQENLQMNATTVTNAANYQLFSSVDETFGNGDDVNESSRITGVTFNPGNQTATVTLTAALPARRYQFIIKPAVTDQAGNSLGGGIAFVSPLEIGVPILSAIGNKTVFDSVLTSFTATATDPDGGVLAFSLGAAAPVGAAITSAGVFTWTPTEAQAGASYNIKVIVSDNNVPTLTDSETITINVVFNPAPVLTSALINDGFVQRSRVSSVTLQFSEDVSSSLSVTDLTLINLNTGTTVDSATMALTYDSTQNRARLTFPGLAGQRLPEGPYKLSVARAGVTDIHGKALASDFSVNFHVLTGDVNGDGVTNDRDLFLVFSELSKAPAARNLNEDLTGDGQVTTADLDIVRSNYLGVVPAATLALAFRAPPQETILPPAAPATEPAPIPATLPAAVLSEAGNEKATGAASSLGSTVGVSPGIPDSQSQHAAAASALPSGQTQLPATDPALVFDSRSDWRLSSTGCDAIANHTLGNFEPLAPRAMPENLWPSRISSAEEIDLDVYVKSRTSSHGIAATRYGMKGRK